jgi:hypothetical protein
MTMKTSQVFPDPRSAAEAGKTCEVCCEVRIEG